jgi:putative nucleotidyltransferase with HDIG domain
MLQVIEEPRAVCYSAEKPDTLPFSEIISALSFALDLTEGQPMGHALRSCILGMRIAGEAGLDWSAKSDLYYALLLKDLGCSSNSSKLFHIIAGDELRAKREVKTTDWTRIGWDSFRYALRNVSSEASLFERVRSLIAVAANQRKASWELIKIRCERGAAVARKIHLSDRTAHAIYSLDEHWNGRGYPLGLKGDRIPLLARIMNLAQTLEVFHSKRGELGALAVMHHRSGSWFDPSLARAAQSLHNRAMLFQDLHSAGLKSRVLAHEPQGHELNATEEVLDEVCEAFAEVVDAKSPFTYQHSERVANVAVTIARRLGTAPADVRLIRRAALLHDIGKLGVPNNILEKPDKLTLADWESIKLHPFYTHEILRRISGFEAIAEVAASHHEKLDGSGYFRNLTAATLSMPCRILAVADTYDALSAARPYREALGLGEVRKIMRDEAPHGLDADCVEAIVF